MRKAGGELSMLLLLVAWAAATWPVSEARVAPSPAAALVEDSKQMGLPGTPFIPPIIGTGGDPTIMACWSSLLGIENCVTGIYGSFLGGQILLSPQCCNAIDGLNNYCFPKMFAVPPFDSSFPNLLKSFCPAHSISPAGAPN